MNNMDSRDKNALIIIYIILLAAIIGALGYYDVRHDYERECSYCHEVLHEHTDDYVISRDGQYYHPECYLKLKEEQ